MKHDAIVVTSWSEDIDEKAIAEAGTEAVEDNHQKTYQRFTLNADGTGDGRKTGLSGNAVLSGKFGTAKPPSSTGMKRWRMSLTSLTVAMPTIEEFCTL